MWEFSGPDDQVAEVPNFTSTSAAPFRRDAPSDLGARGAERCGAVGRVSGPLRWHKAVPLAAVEGWEELWGGLHAVFWGGCSWTPGSG